MAKGGYRPGAGRPKGVKNRAKETAKVAPDIRKAARKAQMSPLEYMLAVMNDDDADDSRRDRMAVAAAPFVHAKPSDKPEGKRAQRQAAAEGVASGGSRFAPPSGPKLVVNNKS
jgi:hypothetical protein